MRRKRYPPIKSLAAAGSRVCLGLTTRKTIAHIEKETKMRFTLDIIRLATTYG